MIEHSEQLDKIGPALAKAQKSIISVGQSGYNKYDNYKYATLDDYVGDCTRTLGSFGLSMVFSSELIETGDRRTAKGGTEYIARVRVVCMLMHDSGQWVKFTCTGEGQDRADKAIYKAITGARKYAIAQALNVATSDDPERDETVGLTEGSGGSIEPHKSQKDSIIESAKKSGVLKNASTLKTPDETIGEDAAALIEALQARGLVLQDLRRAMLKGRVPGNQIEDDDMSNWPNALQPKIRQWIARHPLVENGEGDVSE